jgi:hypothetical protein
MDLSTVLTVTALALPSLAYGVGTARSISRIRYLEDENNKLRNAVRDQELRFNSMPIRIGIPVKARSDHLFSNRMPHCKRCGPMTSDRHANVH